MKRWVRALAAAVVALASPAARADTPPSIWDCAKDAHAEEAWAIHLDVQRTLARLPSMRRGDMFDFAPAALAMAEEKLERIGAATSPDVRLRFDLGVVLVESADSKVDREATYRRAIAVLAPAVAMAPDHPAVDNALWALAVSCGHVGDSACEKRAYAPLLALRTEDERRATPTLNLAEAEMHLGNLKEAVLGYREAYRLASHIKGDVTDGPLARWGLAVALDRSGDHLAAEREAFAAVEAELAAGWRTEGRPPLLHTRGVFFFPSYELYWYDGLENVALAKRATNPLAAVAAWREAENLFEAYVRGAEVAKEKDRWLEIARARLAAAKAGREEAERRAGTRAAPRREPDRTVHTL
jgi:hypothetical protein